MFAFIRHAGYHVGSGTLTEEGMANAHAIALKLASVGGWKEIRTSPAPRAQETADILSQKLGLPVIMDDRVGMDGQLSDLLPPTEPHGILFVSHLPVITRMARVWSTKFKQDEPPMLDVACGFLIDPEKRTIATVRPILEEKKTKG